MPSEGDGTSNACADREMSVRALCASSDDAYVGTADAVHQSRDLIRSLAPSRALVLAADHVYRMDDAAMLADHQRTGARVTVGCVEVPATGVTSEPSTRTGERIST